MNATLDQIAPEIVQAIVAQATARGLSVNDYLRQLLGLNNGAGAGSTFAEACPEPPQKEEVALTPYQIAKAKGLLGAVKSGQGNPASPPLQTDFGQHLLEEYQKQLEELTQSH